MKAGWEVKALGDVCEVVNGGTPKSAVSEYWGGEVQWLTPKDMGKLEGDYVSETPRKITVLGLAKCSARLVPSASLIMSTRAPIGHLAINEKPMAFNQGCRGLVPSKNVDLKYLFYWMSANVTALNELGTGATFKELSGGALKGFKIPLPPLEEQKRIVAVLDAAFEGLIRARTHIETNLHNAQELFESYRDDHLVSEAPVPLSQYLEKITYGFTNPMPNAEEGPFKITAKNVIGGEIDFEGARQTTQEAFDELLTAKSKPQIGDVLLTKDGTLGRTAIVDRDGICVNQSVAVLTPTKEILPAFLHEILSCRANQDAMISDAGGATIKHLYITRVPKIPVSIPSLSKQKILLAELRRFQEDARRCVNHYRAKLQDLDDLRQSLLQKAFAGELT